MLKYIAKEENKRVNSLKQGHPNRYAGKNAIVKKVVRLRACGKKRGYAKLMS